MTNEKLGLFGHHPEPAYDFCVEVEVLQGMVYDVYTEGLSVATLLDRIAKAMEFVVGGDEQAILAKGLLYEIETKVKAMQVPKSSVWFAWVNGNTGPSPQLWYNGDKGIDGKEIKCIWKYNLDVGEEIDFNKLMERFPVQQIIDGKLVTKQNLQQYAKVSLLNYTGYGMSEPADFAARLLCYTKATRLEQSAETYERIRVLTEDELFKELEYMSKTIRSSWEFVDYTFQINNVTRAFTHQLVRTRTGSYAQQAQRVVDMSRFGNSVPDTVQMNADAKSVWTQTMDSIAAGYLALQARGIPNQDARGVLPTNVHTNIIAKFNLRTLADLVAKRKNLRAQGEYGFVAAEMERCVLAVHPWAKVFLSPDRLATPALDDILKQMLGHGSPIDKPLVNAALKEIDALKGTWG